MARILLVVAFGLAFQDGPPYDRKVATIPEGLQVIDQEIVWSKDGTSVMYPARRGTKWVVVHDDRCGEEYDAVGQPYLSADGGNFAHAALKGGKWFIVRFGRREGDSFDEVRWTVMSADATTAFAARVGAKWRLHVGDRKYPEYDDMAPRFPPVFSPNGKLVAVAAKKGGKWCIVVGDKEGPAFDDVGRPAFSADSKVLAYPARDGKGEVMVINGAKSDAFSMGVSPPRFGTAGSMPSWVGLKLGAVSLMVGTRKTLEVKAASNALTTMAAGTFDGRVLAYRAAVKDLREAIVVNDKVGEIFDRVGKPVFSPTGTNFAYAAFVENQSKGRVLSGDSTSEDFDFVTDPEFTANGRQVCFGARDGRELWWKIMQVP